MAQTHIIKKQILDIALDSESGALALQNELSDIYNRDIVPLIDACCSELCDSSAITRIDRLELDLGNISPAQLKTEFVQRMAELFPGKLAQAIKNNATRVNAEEQDLTECVYAQSDPEQLQSSRVSAAKRDSEIVVYYLKTGRLPWWASINQRVDLKELLNNAITENPDLLKKLLRDSVQQSAIITRLVYQCERTSLEKIVNLFGTGQHTDIIKILDDLIEILPVFAYFGTSDGLRTLLWRSIITSIINDMQGAGVIQKVAEWLAARYAINYHTLYRHMLEQLIALGHRFLEPELGKVTSAEPATDWQGLNNRTSSILGMLQELAEMLGARLANPIDTGSVRIAIKNIVDEIQSTIVGGHGLITGIEKNDSISAMREISARLEAWTRMTMEDCARYYALLAAFLNADISVRDMLIVNELLEIIGAVKNADNKTSEQQARLDVTRKTGIDPFSDSEEICINNAGLVIFWPYIRTLFVKNGLVMDEDFLNEESQRRAVHLLHYLATGLASSDEYDLVLNKILCGLHPDTPVEVMPVLTEDEIKECDILVSAVIHNWAVLKGPSAAWLREMFILREGMLSMRDGHWVLRVAEQAYDILIDQLPWGMGAIKLPWMEELLFVEWRL